MGGARRGRGGGATKARTWVVMVSAGPGYGCGPITSTVSTASLPLGEPVPAGP